MKSVVAVDLFCGVGGLTHGLEKAGLKVIAGIDIDPKCEYAFEANNDSRFILKSVDKVNKAELQSLYAGAEVKVLAGCAPCQPFSTYSQGTRGAQDDKWKLLFEFQRLISESQPDIVTMENVPLLVKNEVFTDFVQALKKQNYYVHYSVVECVKYGLPQTRKRLVLLASKLGELKLSQPTHKEDNFNTVKDAIKSQPQLQSGKTSKNDLLHKSSLLSDLNMERIKYSKPGGSWRDWPVHLVSECHKKHSGRTYVSVYGRMEWNKPSPTITTQFFGFGNGRFGHPTQDRALSLREGAILQSFPKDYKFCPPGVTPEIKTIGRLIGNAVPVRLGEVIGESIMEHISEHAASR
ncbi:DNA cytosine methyltransferase [Leucothrix arctica]|uniref:Cytosine-specific methyltransferase n=1 Tax=Leucothrix arctica TaxID=1481894 RepID=A0A317C4C2_9GAMM|nr:DNA (cytosine-5-)-methyltransferase [Leucothrix arctica]PWQ93495.1 DNA (cytosine-5-)-methyltransferase [Leucothrix arctica]